MRRVAEFHRAFGSTDPSVPTPPNRDLAKLRLRLIEEEYKEVRFELNKLALHAELGNSIEARLETLSDLLKELCDLRYVVEGCAEALGLGAQFEAAYEEVHRANMSKHGGGVREDGKILKGPNYAPADMTPFVHVTEEAAPYNWSADDIYDPLG